ncbi:hypothetical protein EHP00_1182 [Ecytonucleospora hepatopenaei]|uniref:Uncharacterized protein n=1 Tax=Ecytonucleospora hepatopenaei TaxID=646526 RepID=A0A1W0E8F0_9MICR|nr:hypothetical protein EHP00_2574 [Ecytonucleospora hepatopenaei]OQS55508.1 hypothetical protein EHP00_1182 [Ecytonucleospora hepatopenaei]
MIFLKLIIDFFTLIETSKVLLEYSCENKNVFKKCDHYGFSSNLKEIFLGEKFEDILEFVLDCKNKNSMCCKTLDCMLNRNMNELFLFFTKNHYQILSEICGYFRNISDNTHNQNYQLKDKISILIKISEILCNKTQEFMERNASYLLMLEITENFDKLEIDNLDFFYHKTAILFNLTKICFRSLFIIQDFLKYHKNLVENRTYEKVNKEYLKLSDFFTKISNFKSKTTALFYFCKLEMYKDKENKHQKNFSIETYNLKSYLKEEILNKSISVDEPLFFKLMENYKNKDIISNCCYEAGDRQENIWQNNTKYFRKLENDTERLNSVLNERIYDCLKISDNSKEIILFFKYLFVFFKEKNKALNYFATEYTKCLYSKFNHVLNEICYYEYSLRYISYRGLYNILQELEIIHCDLSHNFLF